MIRNIRDLRSGRKTHSQMLKPALLGVAAIAVVLLCLVGGMFLIIGNMIGGPSIFAVMRQTEAYLEQHYGDSSTWRFSVIGSHVETSTNPPAGYYTIGYHYQGHTGKLRARHTDFETTKTFEFEEIASDKPPGHVP